MSQVKLSLSIMAHPSRKRFFPYLAQKLGNCPISIDQGRGLWENSKRAWQLFDPKCHYHAVIQDDAIICDNFQTRAQHVIEKSNEIFKNQPHIVNFYYDQILIPENGEEIIKQGYIIRSRVNWAVAICLPTNLIGEMINYCQKIDTPQDDEKITRFMKAKNLKCYFPIPSLVDHRTDTPTLVGTDYVTERKAWRFSE